MTDVCAFCYTNDNTADDTGVCKDCISSTFVARGERAIRIPELLDLRVEIAKRTSTLFDGHYVVYLPEQGAEAIPCSIPDGIMVSDNHWLNKDFIDTVTCEKCKEKIREFDKQYKASNMTRGFNID